ncbi:transcriptional antiterminator RfaH [Pseudomonas sp. TE3786]
MERLSTTQPAWYLLQCKAHQDSRAEDNLLRQNYVTFRPQLVTQRLLRGKRQSVLESLFPGYLFIQLSHEDNWSALRSTRGVSRIVNFNHGPATVTDQVIEHLRARCSGETSSQLFKPGDKLQIIQGPLNTLEGIFLSMDGTERVMILLQLLSREQPVRVPLSHIKSA